MDKKIKFILNGNPVISKSAPNRTLLWVLRTDFQLTGTKYGCGEGHCGACTVLVNNEAVRSCQMTVKDVAEKEVVTIEGLTLDGNLHPLQKAFIEHNAFQCAFCTSGMILNAYGLLMKNPKPSQNEIIEGMNDNLCRCGAHIRIIRAIESAAVEMNEGKKA